MKSKFIALLVCVPAALLFVAATCSQPLYGVAKDNNLYTIDLLTGDTTLIGPLNIAGIGGAGVSEIAFDPTTGLLYATIGGGGGGAPAAVSGCLYIINRTTGEASLVGCDPGMVGKDPYSSIAFDSHGNLYGTWLEANWGAFDSKIHFGAINKLNGRLTEIGSSPIAWNRGSALDFGPDDVLYYHDEVDGLSTIDPATGVQSVIGKSYTDFPSTNHIRAADMSFTGAGMLFGTFAENDTNTNHLGIIDTDTGEADYVITISAPDRMNAIAFYIVPASVPALGLRGAAVLAAVMLTLAVVLTRRRSRRAEKPGA